MKLKPKKSASLFKRKEVTDVDGTLETEDSKKNETIEESIERRAKLSKLRNPRVKFAVIFMIKTVETFAASIIPSLASVMVIFMNPNERSWAVMKVISFFVTAYVNWRLWLKYAALKSGPREFYLMNGLTYLFYMASSIAGYYTMGYFVYSMTYANLRVFELFGMKTMHSILCANGLMILILICCERFSDAKFKKFLAWLKKNGSEKIEMDDILTDDTPMQRDQVVETLSLEEIAENMKREDREAADAKKLALELMPETAFDDERMTKGQGEAIEKVEIENIDNDLTDGDFDAFAAAREEYEQNMGYSGDSLWSSHIYEGRTPDGKPIAEYGEEDFREVLEREEAARGGDAAGDTGLLWDKSLYRGRDSRDRVSFSDPDAGEEPSEDAYNSDELWEAAFYQGRNAARIPKRELDFDDTVPERSAEDGMNYDADSLWDDLRQGRGDPLTDDTAGDSEVGANLNADYDPDSLWAKIYQGERSRGEK